MKYQSVWPFFWVETFCLARQCMLQKQRLSIIQNTNTASPTQDPDRGHVSILHMYCSDGSEMNEEIHKEELHRAHLKKANVFATRSHSGHNCDGKSCQTGQALKKKTPLGWKWKLQKPFAWRCSCVQWHVMFFSIFPILFWRSLVLCQCAQFGFPRPVSLN